MLKYKEGKNGEDFNKNDFEIAFWVCFWNDKAKLGLDTEGCVELANQIKAITYFESTAGYNTTAETEGLMGVNDLGNRVKQMGWVNKDFKTQMNVNDNKGVKAGIQASLYVGIAHYLMSITGYNYGNQSFSNWLSKSENERSSYFQTDKYAIWAGAYGGPNDFVKIYFGVLTSKLEPTGKQLPSNWAVINPYGNAVDDLATKGKYIGSDHTEKSCLP